ncbi:MAG: hypothetical protein RMK32_00605 [Anaerolineae bacterium]|nr:hypothetical protein [Anaerolineae bacterium]
MSRRPLAYNPVPKEILMRPHRLPEQLTHTEHHPIAGPAQICTHPPRRPLRA